MRLFDIALLVLWCITIAGKSLLPTAALIINSRIIGEMLSVTLGLSRLLCRQR